MSGEPSITAASKTGSNDDNVIFGHGQTEVQRLDMQHRVLHDANPKLVLAPIDISEGGLKILDQATGSGIWLRDVREKAGGAHNTYVGTDIEDNYFPEDPPADTSYHHQSMTKPWPKDWEGTFDLVHSRMALPGVGTNPLDEAVHNLVALVKPGGWIQLSEVEWDNWEVGSQGHIFHNAIKDLFSIVSSGQGVDLREKLMPMLEQLGLKNMDYKILTTPFGARASDKIRPVSEASLFATAMGVSMTTKMLPPISVSREQLDAMPQKLLDEARNEGCEFRTFVLWAQKPTG